MACTHTFQNVRYFQGPPNWSRPNWGWLSTSSLSIWGNSDIRKKIMCLLTVRKSYSYSAEYQVEENTVAEAEEGQQVQGLLGRHCSSSF